MRCYICDWSSTGEQSLFHETLQLDNFVDDYRNSNNPGINYNNNYIVTDNKGRDICAHCHQNAKHTFHEINYENYSFNDYEWMDDLTPANDNQPIDVEFEEIA
jgi:hypothetical protein